LFFFEVENLYWLDTRCLILDYFEIATVAYGSFAMTENRGPMLRQGFSGQAYRRRLNNPVINWGEREPPVKLEAKHYMKACAYAWELKRARAYAWELKRARAYAWELKRARAYAWELKRARAYAWASVK